MNNAKMDCDAYAYEDNAGVITLMAWRGDGRMWGMSYNGDEATAVEDFRAIAFDGRDPIAEGWDNIVDDSDDGQVFPCDYEDPIASGGRCDGTPFVLWNLEYAGGAGKRFAREFGIVPED